MVQKARMDNSNTLDMIRSNNDTESDEESPESSEEN
jgi:hypothetical protein